MIRETKIPLDHEHTQNKHATETLEIKIQILNKAITYQALLFFKNYHQTSNISGILEGNKIVDHSDVVGASPGQAQDETTTI